MTQPETPPLSALARSILDAEARIRPYVRETPLEHSPYYSERIGANVWLKCENLQHTGSFKARGALNKILLLSEAERARGVVTASSGNHGAGVAFALSKVGAKGLVFVPEVADKGKIAAIEQRGVEVRVHGEDGVITERYARDYANEHGLTYVSPYNDAQVVAGQGTIGVELERQCAVAECGAIDSVLVAIGGGGLIGGIAGYLRSVSPDTRFVGCQPEHSQVMKRSIEAGRIVHEPSLPTLSDGTAGGIEEDSITFELCRDLVDRYVAVSEADIAASMRDFIGNQHMLIEGAAGVALAALVGEEERYAGQNVVVLVCGANVALETLAGVLEHPSGPTP